MKNYNYCQSMCYLLSFTLSDETTFIDVLLLNSRNKQKAYVEIFVFSCSFFSLQNWVLKTITHTPLITTVWGEN